MSELTLNKATRDGYSVVTSDTGASSMTFAYNTEDEKTAIIIANSHASESATVTLKAGNGLRSTIGDLSVTVEAGETGIIGPLDSMRFKDIKTGNVTLNISGGTTELTLITL